MGKHKVPVPAPVERALDTALDKALAVQRPVVLAYLRRVRAGKPHASPAMVVEMLELHAARDFLASDQVI